MLSSVEEGLEDIRQGKSLLSLTMKIERTKEILSLQEKKITPEKSQFYDYAWERTIMCSYS